MSSSFHEDYYDVASIQAEEEIVPARFLVEVEGLGYLNPHGSLDEAIPVGTVLELPFWLAKTLREKNFVEIETPRLFGPAARGELKADAAVLSLEAKGDFYQIGAKYGEMSQDRELAPGPDCLLIKVFAKRLPDILNRSQSAANEDVSRFTKRLTHAEQQLFMAGKASATDVAAWKQGLRIGSQGGSMGRPVKRQRR